EASGVGMRLEGEALRTAPLVAASRRLADGADEVAVRAKARAFALHGGEDYALVVTVPDGAAPVAGFRRIGRCVAPSARPLVVAEGDEELTVEPRGWDHFSAAGA
ncbi:MAG: hypothetical protein KC731_06195, partial [Myxococcales bacterium]|nr:hypothetical protein [Myxococcales bacterium]